jgi:hypothetical protein
MMPSAVRGIFLLPPTAFFFASYRPGISFINKEGISQHIGWELGKISTWWEKFRHGGKNSSLEMGHGRKNYHIVGKIPNSDMVRKKTRRGIHERHD